MLETINKICDAVYNSSPSWLLAFAELPDWVTYPCIFIPPMIYLYIFDKVEKTFFKKK